MLFLIGLKGSFRYSQRGIDAAGQEQAPGPAHDSPPLYLLFLDALQIEGDALAGPGLLHVFMVRLNISDSRLVVSRVDLDLITDPYPVRKYTFP